MINNLTFAQSVIVAIVTIIVAPILGALIYGIDRKISARMQGRMGPPIIQPFYDVIKLWNKEKKAVNTMQIACAFAYFAFALASLVMLVLGQDLLMIIFVLAFAGAAIILGALCVPSPYSHLGGQREILQMLAYEPILILLVVGYYLTTNLSLGQGSFMVSDVFALDKPLLYYMPLLFIALLFVLTVKLRKSPFDISGGGHAHQEIVRGILTEYSGPYLALCELTHFVETVFLLLLLAMFWATNIWIGIAIALVAYFLEMVCDNIFPRLTWKFLLQKCWGIGIGISLINVIWLYLAI